MKKFLTFVLALSLSGALLTGCARGGRRDDNEIVLLLGMFSEINILMHMAGHLIEEYTDLSVSFHDPMWTVAAANAIESGEVDLWVNYDGTLLTTILGYDPSDVPPGELLLYWTRARAQEERGLTLLDKFGFENTYALAVRQDFAEQHNLRTISDLVPLAPTLVFGAEHEFFDIEGTMRYIPFNAHYGIEWGNSLSIQIELKYAAMEARQIDVTMVYSTDGLNKRFNLHVLEDDRAFFPEYNAMFLTRTTLFDEFAQTAPNLQEVLAKLDGQISNETMAYLNYLVDGENQRPEYVARQFLISIGLL